MNRTLFSMLVVVFATSPILAQEQDSPGATDHPLITRYAGSVLDGYEVQTFNEFDLPLGPVIQDADGSRVFSKKETLEGKITRHLYQGPEDRSTLEIFRNYRSALEESGFEILFECSGDNECGRLFHWPLFHDDTQITTTKTSGRAFDVPKDIRYLAARLTTQGSVTHVSLLVAIDGIWTKQPVTLLDVIESEAMDTGMVTVNADAMAKGIDATGHIAIYGIYFDTDSDNLSDDSDETLEQISNLLDSRPSLNLLVVGHTDNQGGYDQNMDLSQRRAAAVVKALVDRLGVNADRLTGAGVGFLSPVATNDTEDGRAKNRRVELVKR
ncbi:MAG: OmpA family protein [Rhodothermia bacterium]